MIPQAAPQRRIARFRSEIDRAIAATLGSDQYVLGRAVEAFEIAFAACCTVEHAVGVASGTDALALSLRALDIGPGDEVITPALTFAGTAQAILQTGATPRFVDVDLATRCIDPAACAAAITARTAAIVPVHLFGHPCDMPAIMRLADRHGLTVIEDCAQAHGATLDGVALGSFGHAAAFSFYPTKNLGCVGDGGAVVTRDGHVAHRIRSLRNYGFAGQERVSRRLGFNSRLDEIQASILRVLLRRLDEGNAERRAIAARYHAGLDGLLDLEGLGLPPRAPGAVYHQFAVTSPRRDVLRARLAAAGFGTAVHYDPPLHRHPAFAGVHVDRLPATERLAATLLSLPIQPEVAGGHVDAIVDALTTRVMAE